MADSDGGHELWRKIAEMYSEVDDRIARGFGADIVLTVLREVQRIRLELFEKRLAEARTETSSSSPPRETLN